jgi:hypothetical protein
MLKPINQRLAAEGKPTITAAQLRATAQDALQRSITQGRVDQQILERSLAENTALSRADVRDLSGKLESEASGAAAQLRGQLQDAAQSVETGALKAADATGKAFWWIFGALALGLAASLAGGALGVAKPARAHTRGDEPAVARTRVPIPQQREVFP